MADSTQNVENVFNHMVDVTVRWSQTQIDSLNAWNGNLQNWTDTNQTLMEAQVSDPLYVVGGDGNTYLGVDGQYHNCTDGDYYLDSVEYQQWLDEGKPEDGPLYDIVNEQCLMVTGGSIDDYATYCNTLAAGGTPGHTKTGLEQVHDADSMNQFISDFFASGDTAYLDAVSSTFITECEGLLGTYCADDDSYAQDMTLFNNISSTVSAKNNEEETPSSNMINTQGNIIQQTTSAMDVITGANKQMQDVLSSLISSCMGKF